MTTKEFNEIVRDNNKLYRSIFGYIPSIKNYSCTREEYIENLKKAVREKREIHNYLPRYGTPMSKDSEL